MSDAARWSMVSLCSLPGFVNDVVRRSFALTESTLPSTPQELREITRGHDVLLTSIVVPVRAEYVAELAPSIRAVATYSVGLDHLDVGALRERNIAVFNTPDVLTDSVADVALLHILATLRRATESIELVRSRQWHGWTPSQLLGREASQMHLGIFGMGRIGCAVARRARACGMIVHYCKRSRLDPRLEEGAIFHADVARFLASIDVLVLSAPSNASTRHFLNTERLATLRPGSIVVNIARGDLVDDDALIAALERGHVSAAGLDVFENEPVIDSRYFELSNVFMTPHIGSSTVEARRRMAEALVSGLEGWRNGRSPGNRAA